eukprot:CAMPEP_0194511942 /NCGR_PEP_ID=MMETSP0253-20130528/43765_1 /TAXON_ID=2966 /ORGANISM="Noctiluca scintillans" /LENGTH=420 /DNA_ID=CAMNT_0039355335 /DNA_START=101 /DNA_END=1363 /DNA_ORIENTATION=+
MAVVCIQRGCCGASWAESELAAASPDCAEQRASAAEEFHSLLQHPVQSHSGIAASTRNLKSRVQPGIRHDSHVQREVVWWVKSLHLTVGIFLGVALVLSLGCCLSHRFGKAEPPSTSEGASSDLSLGQFQLSAVNHNGSMFHQFSWTLESVFAAARVDGLSAAISVVGANRLEVARASGTLLASPPGVIDLTSSTTWAVVGRATPSSRPGQLWDFRICRPDGSLCAEVKQRSETKCVVEDPARKRLMTVIGNFAYPVFLSGGRNIHIWLAESLVAQCEAESLDTPLTTHSLNTSGGDERSSQDDSDERCAVGESDDVAETDDMPTTGMVRCAVVAAVPPDGGDSMTVSPPLGTVAESEEESGHSFPTGVSQRYRFVVNAVVGTDMALVLSVLLGLQDVHHMDAGSEEEEAPVNPGVDLAD